MFLLAQISRIISAFFGIISDKSSNRKQIYLFNSIANIFSGIQYYLLNAITGAISCIVAIFRNIIFYKYNKKVPLYVLIIYIIALILLNSKSYVNYFAVIPVLLVIVYSVSLYINKVKVIKYAILITDLLEIIYDVYYKAYAGIAVCLIDAIIVIISLIKDKDVIQKEDKNI